MSADTSVIVKTTVPESQKSHWVEHAEALGMSQSEFVRSMVQAGRRGFDLDPPEAHLPTADPRGDGLETRVLEVLSGTNEPIRFDDLLEAMTADLEGRLERALESLQDDGVVDVDLRGGLSIRGGADGDD